MENHKYSNDIYTEPDISPDTLANLGPLRFMAGTWKGTKGEDVNPKADGPQFKSFSETLEMNAIDHQFNGPQFYYGMIYNHTVESPGEDATFHSQNGYWLWEPATNTIIQTLSIPRGQTALAMGTCDPDATEFEIRAERGSTVNGICSNPFLEKAFKTLEYRCKIKILSEDSWSYSLVTVLELGDTGKKFEHTDDSTLIRVAPPKPNPLSLKLQTK